jgi:hypothetical protein
MLAQGTPPRVVFDTISAMVRKEGNNVAERIDDLRRLVHGGIEKGIYQPAAARGVPIVDVEQAKQRFVLNSHEQLLDRDPPEWMIEKFITRRSLSAIYAPPASFKSFIGLDMGLCIAVGHEWHGFATSPARVVYVGSEGSGSVGMRIQAWANARLAGALIPPEQFLHLGVDVNMLDPVELRGFIDAVKDRIDPDLIIVDTVARNFGSGDENSTKDMSAFVNNIGRLMEALETSVMLIHHTGKDEAKGARGSSALNGALDHTFRLKREEGSDRVKLITTKQKETDEHAPIFLQMGRVEVTHPKTGEIVSSLVPVRSEPDAGAPDSVTNQEAYAGLRRVHHDILAAIKANPGELNVHQLAKLLGKDIHNFKKTIRLLSIDRGLIRADDSGFYFVVADDHKEGDEDD